MPRHGSGELQQALLVPLEGAEEAPGGAGSSSPLPQAAAASPLSQVVGRARELAGRHVKSWHLKFALGMLAMQGAVLLWAAVAPLPTCAPELSHYPLPRKCPAAATPSGGSASSGVGVGGGGGAEAACFPDGRSYFTVGLVLATLGCMGVGVPPDLAMLLATLALVLANVISREEAYQGFSDPGPLTVGCMFVVAAALQEVGVISYLARALDRVAPTGSDARRLRLAMAGLCLPVMVLSAFVNNTPIVAALVPLVLEWAETLHISPSKLLMPLSFSCACRLTTPAPPRCRVPLAQLLTVDASPHGPGSDARGNVLSAGHVHQPHRRRAV
eukprot:COSAG01_NODE_500_length_16223_cov_42.586988_11_plen_329_part_00